MNLRHKLSKWIRRSPITIGLILTLLALSLSVSAQEGESCKLPVVKVGFTASMCSHNPYTISLNGTQVTGTGDCTAEQWVTSALTYTDLKVDETYTLTVGADSCSTHINFVVPEGYKLEIDGIEAKSIDKVSTMEGGGDGSWNVVLRQKCACGGDGPGDSPGPKRGSVLFQVGMGRLSNGMTAHSINLREKILSTSMYTPAALVYSPPGRTNEVDVVRNADESLRQVKAPQALADIIVISTTEYEIRYYRAADVGSKVSGLYTVTGLPFVKWKIKNPDPSTTTKLQISKIQGVLTDTSEYTWDAISDSWTLSTGNGARVETSTITYPTPTSRVEAIVVKDNGGLIISKSSRTYHTFAWGEELIQEVFDPDGAALKTAYSYYENQAETGKYSRLKSVIYPDGSWEKNDYDSAGNMVLVLRPWKDQSIGAAVEDNSHATRYTYSNSDGVITSLYTNLLSSITEKIGGIIVKKTTYSRTGTAVNGHPAVVEIETVSSLLTESLVTTSTRYHSTAPPSLANRIVSIEYPNGRKESRFYEKGNFVPNADPALSTFTPDVNGLAERETMVDGTVGLPLGIAFKTMKETSIRDQYGNQVLRETYVYTGTDYERIGWTSLDHDDRGHIVTSRNHKGELTTSVWTGDQKTSEIASSGIETTYTYDSLNRMQTKTKKGIAAGGGFAVQNDVVTTFSYDAEGQQTSEVVSGASLSLSSSRVYDKVGRISRETNQAGLNTTYSYPNGGRTQIITSPGGATQITDRYLDGQTKSVTGSAVVAQAFDYGVNADGTRFTQEFAGSAGLNSPRWTKTTIDWVDRTVIIEKPSFTGTNVIQTSFYNTLGQLQKQTAAAGSTKLVADTLYEYDELGRPNRTGLDVNGDGALTAVSTDRLSENDTIFEKIGTDWFRDNFFRNYLIDNDATPTVSVERQRLNNFPLNGSEQTISELTSSDVAGNSTRTTTAVDRASKKQSMTIDTPESNINSVIVSVNGLLQLTTSSTPQAATTFGYDSLSRQISVVDPRMGTSTQSYSATTGELISTNNGAGNTSYDYYPTTHTSAGRLKSETNAAGKKIYFNYNSRGDINQTWGDATYPVEYLYDTYGKRTELHTFHGGQNWTVSVWPATTTGAADVTKWIYQESTGLLTQKQDATLKGATYTYDELGNIKTRMWARGITCTYGYDGNTAELRTITYSDSTPAVLFSYDRGGHQSTISDATGLRTRTFNVAGGLQTEQIVGGILDGVSLTIGYDSLLRRNSLQASHGGNTLSSQTYGYDATSRLDAITSGTQTATQTFYPNSGLLNTTAFSGGTSITRTFDAIGRLEAVTATPAADAVQIHQYTNNNLNQRTRITREDGSYWSYLYNDRGEVMSGKKYWPDNSIVWGAQTEYSFDNVGNRNYAKHGGNQLGSIRQSVYATNSLNQYLQRTVPGAVDVTGTANTAATVSVNNGGTARRGDYFYKELAVDNSTASAYPQINVVGARNNFGAGGEDAVTEKGGRVFVPQSTETFSYDFDGNLTSDGRWTFTWDGENRLVEMQALTGVPVDAKMKLTFVYDATNRRIQKAVYSWNVATSSYQLQSITKFVNDEWNVIAETDENANLKRQFVWGGTLLWMVANNQTILASADGNENVSTLVDATTGKIRGSYDYGPFGETVKSVGDYADQNPFRFSSKYTDTESGLTYYGYRYYSSQLGRWLGRDPAQEQGGLNLVGFIGNDGINAVDNLGLWKRDAEWTGSWYRYVGKAIAECKNGHNDQLSELADLITGDPDDWKYLGISPKIREGQRINIAPLLRRFEDKLRYSVVNATKLFNAAAFGVHNSPAPSATDYVNSFFIDRPQGIADCNKAEKLVHAKGLIDNLKSYEFDELGYGTKLQYTVKNATPEQMLLGDAGFVANYTDYKTIHPGGPFQGENIVKVGPGRYWGFVFGERVRSIRGWEDVLRSAYNGGLATPRTDQLPGFTGRISFLDVAGISMDVFDLRNRKNGH